MTFGPGLSALLETLIDSSEAHSIKLDDFKNFSSEKKEAVMNVLTSFKIGGMRFSKVNYVPMVTCCVFIVMFFVCMFYFQDTPPKTAEELQNEIKQREASASNLRYQISQIDHLQFLPSDKKSAKYASDDKNKKLREFKDKLSSAKKYFTDKQTYYIGIYFFVIKAIQECIIVESPSYIIKNYKYSSALSGLIFFLFTVATLPTALAPSFLKKKFEDRAMLRFFSYMLIASMIIKSQFTEPVYPFGLFVVGSCLVLSLALAVETCCSSILTKVISEKKALSFMNAGLLAGVIDTLGRVTGSTSITIISLFADYSILNCVLYPFWLAVFLAIVAGLTCMYSRLDMKMYVKFG
jgi:sugar phosphate permease